MSHRGHHASHHGTSTDAPTENWRDEAACRETVDPEIFFPLGTPGSKAYDRVAAIAKALCSFCPVITDCLEDVLRTGDTHGIRGGLDPDERAKQFPRTPRKRRPAYPCAQCGKGMGAPKTNKGAATVRYCSDECRAASKRRRQAEYDQRRKAVVA